MMSSECVVSPSFSVVIPTFRRAGHVRDLLVAWGAVDHPRDDFEIIVADDGGGVDLASVVAQAPVGLTVRLLTLPHRSASAARAAGLAAARGRYVLCTDDDCRPDPAILRAYAASISQHPGAALGGRVVNGLPGDLFATTTQDILTYVCDEWNCDPDAARFFTFSNVLFPAGRLRAIGGFDPDWTWRTGEDRDVCRRWCEAGERMVRCDAAVMHHLHGLTWRKFVRQHFHYGQGNHVAAELRTVAGAGAPDWSGLRFYMRLLALPFRVHPLPRSLAVAALVVLAQAATLAGSIEARLSGSARASGER